MRLGTAIAYLTVVGHVRRRGEGRYEAVIFSPYQTMQFLHDVVKQGKVLYTEVHLPTGFVVVTYNKPRIDRGSVVVSLPARFNSAWDELWRISELLVFRLALAQ